MRQTWSVTSDGVPHSVEYVSSGWSHRGRILVDGHPVAETREPWLKFGVDHPFPVAGHHGVVHIRMGRAIVTVDGRSPETGLPVTVPPPMSLPLFAIAIGMAVLPISLGERFGWGLAVIPASGLASAGGGLIMAIGSRTHWSRLRRFALGSMVAVGSLVLTAALATAINRISPVPSERPFAEWMRVDVSAGGFSLAFPSEPGATESTKSNGSISIRIHSLLSDDDAGTFGVVWGDYAAGPADPTAFLASAAQSAAASNGGTLTADQAVTVEGLPGRDLTISVPPAGSRSGYTIRARMVLLAQRLYSITALIKRPRGPAADNVPAFLGSFVLKGP
jgi:hypothetical protein